MLKKDTKETVHLLDLGHSEDGGTCKCWGARHTVTVLCFLAMFTIYCLRTSLSVAMVAMVNSTASASDNDDEDNDDCPGAVNSSNLNRTSTGRFLWDEKTQGTILGAFYYGYIISQLVGGWLVDRIRNRKVLGCACLLSSLLSFAIPSAAQAGSSYLIAIRIAQGLAEGPIVPGIQTLFTEWAPVHERSRLVSFVYSGADIGNLFSMLITGLLCGNDFVGGWPSAFYIFGMLGCVWFILWMIFTADSPAQHPRISDRERRYIEKSVGQRQSLPTPWFAIATSGAVWGLCISHFIACWGPFSMQACLPTYMKHILHFDILLNGFLSSLPFLVLWLVLVIAGILSDCIRRHISTVATRKLMFSVGSAVGASCLISASYVKCDTTAAVVLLILGIGGAGIAWSTTLVNQLDFAPAFAGTLCGLAHRLGNISGVLGPYVVGVLTNHNQTIGQWRVFFYITGAMYVTGIVLFILLGKGEEQAWARAPPTRTAIPVCQDHEETSMVEN